jgi:hypothetical protein
MAWVENFVLKYKLCPFAEKVFTQRTTRYRVFLGSEKEKIIERIKYEVRHEVVDNGIGCMHVCTVCSMIFTLGFGECYYEYYMTI